MGPNKAMLSHYFDQTKFNNICDTLQKQKLYILTARYAHTWENNLNLSHDDWHGVYFPVFCEVLNKVFFFSLSECEAKTWQALI